MELPFLKKKSEAAAGPLVPSWHPNFRNYEKLPDVKQVRTAFSVNFAAIAVACAALAVFGIQEYNLRQLNKQVADYEQRIKQDKKKSDQAVALFKKYQTEEAKINEVDAFIRSKPITSDLLLRLAQLVPKNIAFDSFDLRDTGLNLRISVRGSSTEALGLAGNFLELLRADKDLAKFGFDDFAIVNSARVQNTGRLAVDIALKLKVATPSAPPAAKK